MKTNALFILVLFSIFLSSCASHKNAKNFISLSKVDSKEIDEEKKNDLIQSINEIQFDYETEDVSIYKSDASNYFLLTKSFDKNKNEITGYILLKKSFDDIGFDTSRVDNPLLGGGWCIHSACNDCQPIGPIVYSTNGNVSITDCLCTNGGTCNKVRWSTKVIYSVIEKYNNLQSRRNK